jgi:hypothetical protein
MGATLSKRAPSESPCGFAHFAANRSVKKLQTS